MESHSRSEPLPNRTILRVETTDGARRPYYLYIPGSGGEGAPLFVAVHGLSRNVVEHATLFAGYCERFGAVLIAPLFDEEQGNDFQRLGRTGRGPRSDHALDTIVEDAARRTGAAFAPIHLFGFSGGAQFCHRYAMAYPHRVAGAVLAAAGWYTFPDPRRKYPYGIRSTRNLPHVRFDPEEFLRIPMTVIVGEQDVTGEHLRSTEQVRKQQGETRLERARNWVSAMQAAAAKLRLESRIHLEVIPGGDHVFGGLMQTSALGDRVFAALFGNGNGNNNGNRNGSPSGNGSG
jgi:pimeloyl-ACP methyl ester carboxylesterase